jgi:hypothetical protein
MLGFTNSWSWFLITVVLLVKATVFAKHGSITPPGGTSFAGTRVWGAMIQTDPEMAFLLGRDFYRVPQGVNGTAADNARSRNKHGQAMVKQLPFQVDMWPSVFSSSCPNRPTKGCFDRQFL